MNKIKVLFSLWCIVFLLALFCCLLASCGKQKTQNFNTHNLRATGKIKSFELDSEVKYNAFYLYPFQDKHGRECLSFLNYRTNQILFYDWNTDRFLFKLNLSTEGPNGVTQVSGFYIKDFDHIYVSTYAYNGLIKVDTTGRVVQKIPYGTTAKGYKVVPSYTPSSHPYIAPVMVGDKMYITQKAVPRSHSVDETPLSVVIDTTNHHVDELPLTYSVLTEEEKNASNMQFSRIFNGKDFIYSFYVSDEVIVASVDHSKVRKIKVKSRYLTSATEAQIDNEQGPRLYLELARYGDLIYDSYREVYYRFAYPKVSLDKKMKWWGKSVYGRKKFSVMILDKDFRVVGENLFPEGLYNSFVFFVHKDGLYISRDYQIGTGQQSEDYLTFELFELEKK